MEKYIEKIIDGSVDVVVKVLLACLIIFIGFKLIKIFVKRIQKGKIFRKIEKSSQTFIASILNIGLKIIVLITAIAMIGIPMTSIIAIIGSAGLALGLALQGGLSNIAGGLMIMVFKPFKVGDYIDTHADSGTVKEINIFHTILITPDNKTVVLPNGILSNTVVVNYNSMSERRLDLNFSVGYNSDIKKVKQVLKEIIDKIPEILKDYDIFVALTEQGSDALIFTIRVWVKSSDYFNVKLKILEDVKIKFDELKINIPYKQVDVHLIK